MATANPFFKGFVLPPPTVKDEGAAMSSENWVACDDRNFQVINLARADAVYVSYRGSGNYCIFASFGSRDVLIKHGLNSERDAEDYVRDMVKLA